MYAQIIHTRVLSSSCSGSCNIQLNGIVALIAFTPSGQSFTTFLISSDKSESISLLYACHQSSTFRSVSTLELRIAAALKKYHP